MVAGLKHKTPAVRVRCALILDYMATLQKQAPPAEVDQVLVAALGDDKFANKAIERLAARRVQFDAVRPVLHSRIEGEDEQGQNVAYRAYRAYGNAAEGDIPYLGKLAWEGPDDSAGTAIEVLGYMGPKALPHVVRILDSDRDRLHNRAITSIGHIGAPAKKLVPRLLAMHQAKEYGHPTAFVALMRIDPDDPGVKAAIRKELDGRSSYQMVHDIRFKADPSRFVDELRLAMKHKDPGTRYLAADALADLGKDVEQATEVIIGAAEAYDDKKGYERRLAIDALGDIGARAAGTTPRLLALAKKDAETRERIIETIPKMGRAALPHLRKALEKEGAEREVALACLPAFGPLAADMRDEIAKLAQQAKYERVAVDILNAMNAFPYDAPTQVLVDGLRDKNLQIRLKALDRLGPSLRRARKEVTTEFLRLANDDSSAMVRAAAVEALCSAFGAAQEVQPALIRILDSKDAKTRHRACRAVRIAARNSPIPEPVRARVLAMALGDDSEDVRGEAISALFDGGFPEGAGPRVLEALEHKSELTRACAAVMAGAFPDLADKTVPLLIKMLGDEDDRLRACAVDGIYLLGPAAKKALPTLKSMRDAADDGRVKKALDEVIEQVSR